MVGGLACCLKVPLTGQRLHCSLQSYMHCVRRPALPTRILLQLPAATSASLTLTYSYLHTLPRSFRLPSAHPCPATASQPALHTLKEEHDDMRFSLRLQQHGPHAWMDAERGIKGRVGGSFNTHTLCPSLWRRPLHSLLLKPLLVGPMSPLWERLEQL